MIMLASLRSDGWTACPESVDDLAGPRNLLFLARNEAADNAVKNEARHDKQDGVKQNIWAVQGHFFHLLLIPNGIANSFPL